MQSEMRPKSEHIIISENAELQRPVSLSKVLRITDADVDVGLTLHLAKTKGGGENRALPNLSNKIIIGK